MSVFINTIQLFKDHLKFTFLFVTMTLGSFKKTEMGDITVHLICTVVSMATLKLNL